MKNVKQIFVIIFMLAFILSISSINAFAATVTQDNLEVTLVTDKEKYSENEQIKTTLTVKNNNDTAVTNVDLETALPDGYKLADKSENKKTVDSIAAGESVSLDVTLEKDNTKKDSTPSELSTALKSSTNPVSGGNSGTTTGGTTTSGSAVQTGQGLLISGIIILVLLTAGVVFIFVYRKKKSFKQSGSKMLSILLCIGIVGGTSTLITVKANAAEDSKTIGIETSVTVDGESLKLNGTVKYNISSGENEKVSLSNFTSDEQYFICGKESTITFTVDISNPEDKVELIKNENELVSYMHDDGLDGDVAANDGKYTCVVKEAINSDETLSVQYSAKSSDYSSNAINLYFFVPLTENTAKAAKDNYHLVLDEISKIEAPYINDDGLIKENDKTKIIYAVNTLLSDLVDRKIVLFFEEENGNFDIKLTSGLTIVYSPIIGKNKNIDSIGSDTSATVLTFQPCFTDMGGQNYSTNAYTLPQGVNFVLEMLDDVATDINSKFSNYSFSSSTNYNDNQVTLNTIRALHEDEIVLWHGHGYYGPVVKSCLVTGEDFDWNGWWWDTTGYFEDCVTNRIINSWVTGYDKVIISSKYIEKYCGNLNNSLIYLAACDSGKTSELANSFLNKGSAAVVANSDTIIREYNVAMLYETLRNMLIINPATQNYYSLQEALNTAKTVYGSDDSDNRYGGVGATPNIFGGTNANNYRLCDSKIYVTGNVTDENNNLLDGVNITMTSNDNEINMNQLTNNGEYSFELHKDNKTYTLMFEKGGYVTQTKTIIDVAEDRTLDVVMKKEVVNNPNIPEDAPTFNGHTYYLYTGYTWQEAKDYCESVGGHLVTITSQEEMDFIVNDLESKSEKANCYWIGLQRDGDSWKWITDEPFSYSNWAENEPNNYKDNGENVVHLFGKEYTDDKGTKRAGTWNDVTNEGAEYISDFYTLNNFGYICEWDSVNQKQNDPLAYSQYFALEPVVSNYGSETVDEYGVRLQVNDDAMIRKCAIYMYKDGSEWYRTAAFVGDNITSATYIPYVAYQGNVIYDGTNHSDIKTFNMHQSSDGIWNVDLKGNFTPIGANLEDFNGNYLTFRSKDVVGRNVQIFDDLDDMKAWLLS